MSCSARFTTATAVGNATPKALLQLVRTAPVATSEPAAPHWFTVVGALASPEGVGSTWTMRLWR